MLPERSTATATPKTKTVEQEQERQESIDYLRRVLPKGSTCYCILRSVSRSGMYRRISFYACNGDGHPAYLDGYIKDVLGYQVDRSMKHEGLGVGGCGMDMGFSVIYNLSSKLYDGDGYAISHRWL